MSNQSELKRVLVPLATVALLIALGGLLWVLAEVVLMLFLGILLAIVLRFAAGSVEKYTPIPHPWSLGLVIVALLVVVVTSGILLVPEVIAQFEELVVQVQIANEQLLEFLDGAPFGDDLVPDFFDNPAGLPPVRRVLGNLTNTFVQGFGILANVLFISFTSLFLAVSPNRYRDGLIRLVPPSGRQRAREVISHVISGLKSWLVGRVLSMVLLAVIMSVGLTLMGVPLALALGVLTGLLEFIPVVGPLLSAVPAILMGFTVSPMKAVYVALFYLIIQQLEGNVITPVVQMKTASLPPVITLTAVVAMGILFGPLGVLTATPLAVVILIVVKELYIDDVLERRHASR
ncbi:AI-2E family transporter [Nodosilinea sp. E11]|uniref:AI-2E family transporter n=1 Tax=Nodosilinea sp. E11 TaxID=3037479 RepID=UPI0029350DA6|nr:AI-2E family transporter [Nodosilinea sp. E11]WOD38444.1 AI-2E family transporter [Nodosilinea sp. E11]